MERIVTHSLLLVVTLSLQFFMKFLTINNLIFKTRTTEKKYLEAAKIHPRLRTRLTNFHRQMDLMDKSGDDFSAI
jgi:hypothetical protein